METKATIIERITEQVERITCKVRSVYGVNKGVGYDLEINVTTKSGKVQRLKAHASASSWDALGWLRPNQAKRNEYKGRDKNPMRYEEDVRKYWEQGDGLAGFLERHRKPELLEVLESWTK